MGDIVITAGQYAGAINIIITLTLLVAIKPIQKYRTDKRKKAADLAAQQQDFQRQVLEMLRSIGEDVGDLQCDRLTQAHDYYSALGYCPSDTKQVLVHMHKSYRAKGRNHLCDHYEQDILDLPIQDPAQMV